jgi:adenylate cyclase
MNPSPAVLLVWRMAAVLANRDRTLIEPKHFLSHVFSLTSPVEPAQFDDPQIQSDVDEVKRILEAHGLQPGDILRRLQTTATPTAAAGQAVSGALPSRSPDSKRAFDYATNAAAKESLAVIYLRHLLAGIIVCCEDMRPALGIDAAGAAALVAALSHSVPPPIEKPTQPPPIQKVPQPPPPILPPNPPPQEPETTVVLQTLDATTVLEPKIDWATVGPQFAALCELAWQAGANCSIDTLLQTLAERILSFIPRATHCAILIADPQTKTLDLAAHTPPGTPPVSWSSAQQAHDQKEAFIWKRKQEMSKTQTLNNLVSGVYAPIIADDKSFGVLCLNTKLDTRRSTSRLAAEDLFLAASLGHQIGLVLANRELKEEIKEKVSILERLMTNFSPQVRTLIVNRAKSGKLRLGGERSTVSILCADIRGFTKMAAKMDPDDLLMLLNDYFAAMVECVFRHEGTIDKYIGDALLVVFGSPEPNPRHVLQATKAAIALQEATLAVSKKRRDEGKVTCEIGVGVHTGEVVHGFIGSPDRMEFTVIGDTVNKTTRYCDGAGCSEIIVSPSVYAKLARELDVEPVEVPTKEGHLSAYKLLGMRVL